MIFPEELVNSLKDDPIPGVLKIIEIARQNLVDDIQEWHESDQAVLLETYALLLELIESDLLQVDTPIIELTGNYHADCTTINTWLNSLENFVSTESTKLQLQALRNHFKTNLGTSFCYEFSQGDLDRIQTLINQLRELIAHSNLFEKNHQQRLLKRLEKLQSEMHKRVSDLDRFWGLIGDAGVVIGKFGTDAKPFVDRIREIADVVWRTQSRSEELPSGTTPPLLRKPDDIDI